jgi:hypothetical protein
MRSTFRAISATLLSDPSSGAGSMCPRADFIRSLSRTGTSGGRAPANLVWLKYAYRVRR